MPLVSVQSDRFGQGVATTWLDTAHVRFSAQLAIYASLFQQCTSFAVSKTFIVRVPTVEGSHHEIVDATLTPNIRKLAADFLSEARRSRSAQVGVLSADMDVDRQLEDMAVVVPPSASASSIVHFTAADQIEMDEVEQIFREEHAEDARRDAGAPID